MIIGDPDGTARRISTRREVRAIAAATARQVVSTGPTSTKPVDGNTFLAACYIWKIGTDFVGGVERWRQEPRRLRTSLRSSGTSSGRTPRRTGRRWRKRGWRRG